MNNLKNTIWNKKLPSLFGFFVFATALLTIGWLSTNAILFGTKAAIDETPKNVTISNITDTSFTVSYTTDNAVLGSISYGKDNEPKQTAQATKESTIHFITIQNLLPQSTYTFSIISGSKTFIDNNKPYTITTGPKLENTNSQKTILSGKVMSAGGESTEALISIANNTTQVITTVTKPDGSYELDISNIRTQSLSTLASLSQNTLLQMQVYNATEKSSVSLLASQPSPIPLIILSNNYDFTVSTQPLSPSPSASGSATSSSSEPAFPTLAESTSTTPQILTPKEEQEFKDQQPLFRGKAVPNETVTITINSEHTITATVKADANGNWQYRPDEALEPGTHTITIRTIDASGLIRVITQSFVVYAEGGQFTEPSVSPSASLTPTTTQPTATATPRATNTPTPTKPTTTAAASPSATRAASPTTQPTQSLSASPTKPPIPVTGDTNFTVTVIGVISAIAIGALLFIFAAV